MMTNINNPFEFFDFQKMLAALKVPTVDGNSENLINAQKKTLETFANASKVLFEGYNALDFSKIAEKTAKESFEILNKRLLEGLTEIKKVIEDEGKKASVKN